MKTKELEKYPLQILMMTLTSFLTLLIPKLLSYLIDDILMANIPTSSTPPQVVARLKTPA